MEGLGFLLENGLLKKRKKVKAYELPEDEKVKCKELVEETTKRKQEAWTSQDWSDYNDTLQAAEDHHKELGDGFLGRGKKKKAKVVKRSGQIGQNEEESIGDVWNLESSEENIASDSLSIFVESAMKGNTDDQKYLEGIFEESWEEIKTKVEAEGSTWVVWWMDGVNKHLKNTY